MASIISKVKEAVTNYAKNVAGGAKIVASAVSSAAKKVGGLNQSGAVLNARVGENMTAKQTLQAYKTLGMTPSTSTPKGTITTPKISSSGKIPTGTSLLSSPVSKQVTKGSFKSSGGGSSSLSNISTDGTALTSSLSRNAATSSFSPTPGTTFSSTQGNALSSVVNTPTLGTDQRNQKIDFGVQPAEDYSKYIPAPIVAPETTAKDTALADYLKTLEKEAPSTEDAYAKAQKETQILQKQEKVSTLTEQLNAIVNKGQAAQLSLVGQGRGIPEAIIGGQQAEIGRETAIAALPIQAQLSAAQGDLEMANQNLETLFKIYSDDAEREYSIKKEQKKMVYDIATADEKRALEKLDKAEDRAYNERQLVLKDIKDIATQAMQNQAPASVLSNIFKATTYQGAIQAAGKYGGDYLQRELLLQQIENVKSQIAERNNITNSYGTISGKPQTAAQSSANGYADRVAEADVIIGTLGEQFTGRLAIGGALPNVFQSDDRQMYEQAKRNFVNAILRRESGAAIAESEFVSAERQYFPQAGDQEGVIRQKEISRNTAINNLYREAGVNRPVLPGQIIESNGVRYRVGIDGETLDIIQ